MKKNCVLWEISTESSYIIEVKFMHHGVYRYTDGQIVINNFIIEGINVKLISRGSFHQHVRIKHFLQQAGTSTYKL